ncbi:MAG: hypothetical protein ACNY01_12500 [Desulfobacteria bacterium]
MAETPITDAPPHKSRMRGQTGVRAKAPIKAGKEQGVKVPRMVMPAMAPSHASASRKGTAKR